MYIYKHINYSSSGIPLWQHKEYIYEVYLGHNKTHCYGTCTGYTKWRRHNLCLQNDSSVVENMES